MFNTHRTDLVSSAFTKRIVGLFRTIMCWPFVCLLVHLLNRCYTLLPSSRCVEETYTSWSKWTHFQSLTRRRIFAGIDGRCYLGGCMDRALLFVALVLGSPNANRFYNKTPPSGGERPCDRMLHLFFLIPFLILNSRDRENGVKYNQAMSVWVSDYRLTIIAKQLFCLNQYLYVRKSPHVSM